MSIVECNLETIAGKWTCIVRMSLVEESDEIIYYIIKLGRRVHIYLCLELVFQWSGVSALLRNLFAGAALSP